MVVIEKTKNKNHGSLHFVSPGVWRIEIQKAQSFSLRLVKNINYPDIELEFHKVWKNANVN
jgi:hypothetical protein